ncbi:hypothetical protein GCM10023322_59810 [Rugosimonospora acidiphila]|uniref:Photosynthesis system II assembly factor Ycf48/Hcf136-like domain-containing protein n=1 Tax=Rugosimonospora acidiphila TaxID=556531 RepID=A0ABP9SH49_9ACTN
MPEPDFAGLRDRLEEEVRQPSFVTIRARRRRRTAWTVGAALTALVVVLGGTVSAAALLSPARTPVTGPQGTPSPAVSPTPSAPATPPTAASAPAGSPPAVVPPGSPAAVTAMTAAPSGVLFAATNGCLSGCSAAGAHTGAAVLRSRDLGRNWTTVGYPDGPAGTILLAASDAQLWLIGDAAVNSSTDGGRTWRSAMLGGGDAGDGDYAEMAGGTAWIARGSSVAVATGGGQPVATGAQPPGGTIDALAALGADNAAVLTGDSPATWYLTGDRGGHWSAMDDPCAGTAYPHSPFETLSAAPGGSVWGTCAAPPASGRQLKQLVVSADGGRTWKSRGALEPDGYGTHLMPVSSTVAWRTGPRADLYRTTDAAHWTRVAVTGDAAGGADPMFVAIDGRTGVYVEQGTLYATEDGGQSWRQRPLPLG